MIDYILVDLKLYGIDYVADRVRRDYYGYRFYDNLKTEDGREVWNWIEDYNKIVLKYYIKEV